MTIEKCKAEIQEAERGHRRAVRALEDHRGTHAIAAMRQSDGDVHALDEYKAELERRTTAVENMAAGLAGLRFRLRVLEGNAIKGEIEACKSLGEQISKAVDALCVLIAKRRAKNEELGQRALELRVDNLVVPDLTTAILKPILIACDADDYSKRIHSVRASHAPRAAAYREEIARTGEKNGLTEHLEYLREEEERAVRNVGFELRVPSYVMSIQEEDQSLEEALARIDALAKSPGPKMPAASSQRATGVLAAFAR